MAIKLSHSRRKKEYVKDCKDQEKCMIVNAKNNQLTRLFFPVT